MTSSGILPDKWSKNNIGGREIGSGLATVSNRPKTKAETSWKTWF